MTNEYVEANVDELLVLKGRVKALEGYLNSVTYANAEAIRGIMGFAVKAGDYSTTEQSSFVQDDK